MKKTKIQVTEPVVTIEMSLTDARNLSEILCVHKAKDTEDKLRAGGYYIHPNFREMFIEAQDFFVAIVRTMEAATLG